MSKRDFLTLMDITSGELASLLDRALEMKKRGPAMTDCPLLGKSVGLLFEKASTRTRVSFEVGIYQLGGQSIFLSPRDVHLSRGELLSDTGKVLSRYLSALVVRTYSQETARILAEESDIPVINALTDLAHPCQALADLMTMQEIAGSLKGVRVAWLGDGNNVANSLILGCAMTGMELVLACPEGYSPDPAFLNESLQLAARSGGSIRTTTDPAEACAGAQFLYTDVWTSMGQEEESERRRKDLAAYQLNAARIGDADPDARFLHCLPAHRGEEITEEVMEHPRSAIFDQAENRLHTQKALMEWLLK
ncbi:MAG: ornithine carbamoyltransferase [bacterium]|nr:ornithine carbamoyltransferase [bacterium]MDT8395375.1 ornithine carbamoyltransferase [bacterium]